MCKQRCFYTILGVKGDRSREVLAVVNHPTEGANNWKDIFLSLKDRGVEEIKLMVSDGLVGIEEAMHSVFPKVAIQFNLLFNCFISSRSLLFSFKTKSCSFVRRMCLFSSVENNSFKPLSSLTKESTFVVSNLYFYK